MNVTALPLANANPPLRTQDARTVTPLRHGNASSAPRPLVITAQSISWLWMQLTELYGQTFITKNGVRDSGIWLDTLSDLTPKALETGVARLKGLSGGTKFCDWPPNALQMHALCKAFYEELRLPTATDALREITNKRGSLRQCWSSPLVKFIASRLPVDFFVSANDKELSERFKVIFEKVCDLVKQGHELPRLHEIKEPVVCQPKPHNVRVGEDHLRHMKQLLRA